MKLILQNQIIIYYIKLLDSCTADILNRLMILLILEVLDEDTLVLDLPLILLIVIRLIFKVFDPYLNSAAIMCHLFWRLLLLQ